MVFVSLQMNLALIHDRLHIKTFWEKRINAEGQYAETEEQRRNKSALQKSVTQLTARIRDSAKFKRGVPF